MKLLGIFLGSLRLFYPIAHVPVHVRLWLPFLKKMTHFWLLKSPSNDLATRRGFMPHDSTVFLTASCNSSAYKTKPRLVSTSVQRKEQCVWGVGGGVKSSQSKG